MKLTTHFVLAVLLFAQLVILGYIVNQSNPESNQRPLIGDMDLTKLDSIIIESNQNIDGSEPAKVELQLNNEQIWQVQHEVEDSSVAVLANQVKIQQIIDKLGNQQLTYAVANSDEAKRRFNVDEQQYQRKISLIDADGNQQVLFTGTSPGYQQTHARLANEDNIHSIKVTNFDLADNNLAWINRTQLAIESTITKIQTDAYTVHLNSDRWELISDDETQVIQTELVEEMLSTLASLRIADLSTRSELFGAKVLQITSAHSNTDGNTDGNTELKLLKQGDDHFLQRDDGVVIEISQNQFDKLDVSPIFTQINSPDNTQ